MCGEFLYHPLKVYAVKSAGLFLALTVPPALPSPCRMSWGHRAGQGRSLGGPRGVQGGVVTVSCSQQAVWRP